MIGRLRSVIVAGVAVASVAAGCAGNTTDSAGPTTEAAYTPPPSPTAPVDTVPDAGSTAPASTAPPATVADTAPEDPQAVLSAAFDEIAGGYHFVTTGTIGDQTVVTAEGDRIGDATRLSVTSNGSSVDYIVAPTGAWASVDAEWEALDQPPITDPVTPLRAPATLEVESVDDSVVVLIGTYPPTALSLTGDAPVPVYFVIDGTTLQTITYRADTEQGAAEVVATISPLADATPIELPDA